MCLRPPCLVLVSWMTLSAATTLAAEPPQTVTSHATDPLGDPLPPFARARLGTDRFRHGATVHTLAFSPNGKVIASIGTDSRVRLWDFATGKELRALPMSAMNGAVSIDFSPDGKLLTMACGWPRLFLWQLDSGQELRRFEGGQFGVSTVHFFPDGKTIATTGGPGVALWDVASGKLTGELLAQNPGGNAGERKFGPIFLWAFLVAKSVLLNEDTFQEAAGQGMIQGQAVAYSADGKVLAATDNGNGGAAKIRLWNLATGRELRQWAAPNGGSDRLLFSPDGKVLAVSSANQQTIHLYDTGTGKELRQITRPQNPLAGLAFSPDGKILAGAMYMEAAILWDVATGKEIKKLTSAQQGLIAVAFAPDGRTLAGAGRDNVIRRWHVGTWKELPAYDGHQGELKLVALAPDGGRVVTVGADRTLRAWQTSTSRELRRASVIDADGEGANLNCAAATRDGSCVAVASATVDAMNGEVGKGTVTLWDAAEFKQVRRFEVPANSPGTLAFTAAGRSLASGWTDGTVRVWDLGSGKDLRQLAARTGDDPDSAGLMIAAELAVSPDGRLLATRDPLYSAENELGLNAGEEAASVTIWELASAKKRRHFKIRSTPFNTARSAVFLGQGLCVGDDSMMEGDNARPIQFSPDGKSLTVTDVRTIRLCDARTGKEIRRFGGHNVSAATAVFAPDGKVLAAGTTDGSIYLWDVATGTVLRRFGGHRNAVTCLAFSADGHTLVSGGADSTALAWDAAGLLRPQSDAPAHTASDRLELLWAQLGGDDAAAADQAITALAAVPAQTVSLLAKKLRPQSSRADARVIERLIADLDGDRFETREKAMRSLEKLGRFAEPAVRKAVATRKPPLEVRRRMERVLESIDGPVTFPDRLRDLRAVEVLEQIGSAEARKVLEILSRGDVEAELTREARAALNRLGRS